MAPCGECRWAWGRGEPGGLSCPRARPVPMAQRAPSGRNFPGGRALLLLESCLSCTPHPAHAGRGLAACAGRRSPVGGGGAAGTRPWLTPYAFSSRGVATPRAGTWGRPILPGGSPARVELKDPVPGCAHLGHQSLSPEQTDLASFLETPKSKARPGDCGHLNKTGEERLSGLFCKPLSKSRFE